ncbi:MAG: pilus assembly protein TadG-related protein, partial [Sneathiella sp.]
MNKAGKYKLNALKTIARDFRRDQSGAIAVYIGLLLLVLAGVGALTLDLGRLFVTGTETQSYVDAAALAGAYQLDGQPGSRARATTAINDKLFTNNQVLGALGSADAEHAITISDITFLSSLAGNTVATSDQDANFVQVTADSTNVENTFLGMFGGPDNSKAVRAATAGNTQVICEIPPLMMCNPDETASHTAFSVPAGSQYIAKYTGPGAGMAPGTFGLLDSPTCGQGSKCIAELLGHRRPASGCYSATVDIRPGQANGVRNALNTRFDMYDNPFFGSKKNDPNYHA